MRILSPLLKSILSASLIFFVAENPVAGADDSGEPSLATAHGMLSRGLFDLAEKEYRRVLKSGPDEESETQARYGLAVSLVRQNRFEPATSLLKKLLRIDDFAYAADAAVMLAQCRLAAGEYGAAAEVISDHRSRFDGHALADDAAAIGIEALYRAGAHEACSKNASTFLRQFADSPMAGRVGAFGGMALAATRADSAAVDRLRAALSRGVPASMRSHVQLALAESLHRLGKRGDAIEAFEAVGKSGGALASRAHLGQAVAQWESGHLQAALKKIEKALEKPVEIDFPYAHLIRGRILFDMGETVAARKAFTAASTDASAYRDRAAYWSAKCHMRGGDIDRAVGVLEDAVKSHVDSARIVEMRYDLAVGLVRLERTDEAIDALGGFLEKHDDHRLSQDARRMLAGSLHRAGRYEESERVIADWRENGAKTLPVELAFVDAENAFLAGNYKSAVSKYTSYLARDGIGERLPIARRRLGLAHYQLKQFDEALGQLSALGDGAQTPATQFAIGDIYFSKREWREAKTWLDRFVVSSGDAPTDESLLKSGIACMRLDESETAIRRFDAIIDRGTEGDHFVQAMFEKGQALVTLERFEAASEALQRVLTLENSERFAAASREHLAAIGLQLGRPDLAAETYSALAKSQKSKSAQAKARLRQAQALMRADNFEEAATVLGDWLDSFEDDERRDRALAHYVISLARTDQCEKAIEAFKRLNAGRVDSQLGLSARYDHAWCLRSLKRDGNAAKAFESVVAASNGSSLGFHAMMELATIYDETNRPDEAIAHLQSLAKAFRDGELPGDMPADRVLYRLGQSSFERNQLADAQEVLTELRSKFPKSELTGPAAYLLGEAAYQAERWEDAVSQLTTAVDRGTDADYRGPALLRLGDALAKLHRWKESESRFAAYLESNRDSMHAFQANFGIGWARENDARYAVAIEAYRKVTGHHHGPTAARAQFQIGQCLFAMKDYDSAVRELLKTDILYAYPEWSAAALYEAGRCLERMNRRGEAREQFDAVAKKYAATKWAAPATERLRALASAGTPGD